MTKHMAMHRGNERDAGVQASGLRQSLFRQVNERIEETADSFAVVDHSISVLCECGQAECTERIELSRDEYEALRRYPTRFALLPGHDAHSFGRIVERNERYLAIEAVGEAAVAAIRLDPRHRLQPRRCGGVG
jgi:hypothetical protein